MIAVYQAVVLDEKKGYKRDCFLPDNIFMNIWNTYV